MSVDGSKGSALHRLLIVLLGKVGKGYQPSSDLPTGLVLNVLRIRLLWLVRGLIRFRRIVFVGSHVNVRGKRNIQLGYGSTLEQGVVLDGYGHNGVRVGARSRIGSQTIISCTSHLSLYGMGFSIGSDSGIGEYGYIGAAGGVTIGSNVIMGQYVSFHSQEHEFGDVGTPIRDQGSSERGIVIGDNCWVGARVTFLDGSDVPEGCVVAAGAVVRGEFPAFSVIAGVPARVIRRRVEVDDA